MAGQADALGVVSGHNAHVHTYRVQDAHGISQFGIPLRRKGSVECFRIELRRFRHSLHAPDGLSHAAKRQHQFFLVAVREDVVQIIRREGGIGAQALNERVFVVHVLSPPHSRTTKALPC